MLKNTSKKILLSSIITVLAIIVIFFGSIVHFVTEVLWYREVGYLDTYLKILFSKFVLAVPLFVFIFVLLWIYLKFIQKKYEMAAAVVRADEEGKRASRIFCLVISVISGAVAYVISNNYWMEILKYLNKTNFGIKDPIFGKELSYFIFSFPLISSIFSLAVNLLIVLAIITVAYFLILYMSNPPMVDEDMKVFGSIFDKDKRKLALQKIGRILSTLLMIVGALLFIVLAIKFYLDSFKLLYSERGAVFGAGYTDVHVTMWMNRIRSVASVIIAILLLVGLKGKSRQKIFVAGLSMLLATALLSNGIEAGVQMVRVSPNELMMERPFIEHSIKYTNLAYGLDKIQIKDFRVEQNLTKEDIQANLETLANVPINDERPALEAFNQLQGFRGYYRFYDVDIDRYMIDGEIQQIFLSARELDKEKLDQNAQSWINTKLKYTHGYGLAAAPASRVNRAGQPDMVVQDMPVTSSLDALKVTRPQIYFGELTNDYVVVETAEDEFDYPKGDSNEMNEYEGDAGVKLNFLNRILYAIKYNDFKLLISSSINSDSRILTNRNVVARVKKIAPFLTFEEDAYAIVVDGRIYFVIDGYTTSKFYPYSQPFNEYGDNYIRNSVKAIVDAYHGKVEFYMSDAEDPIIQTYSKIFGKMFLPMEQIPSEIRAHMRYPMVMFDVVSKMYQTFHATDPNIFYNREDQWATPTETYHDNEVVMNPLYFTYKLPDEEKAEFLLSIPFTPRAKQTLTAFLVARNDGEHYGELVLYRFPKDQSIIGPQQIEAQISNNDVISRDLSLWNSQGSEVIRGHVLTIPLENSILYIEPLYIRASSTTAIPEVKRIIVAYNSNIVMAENLELALEKIFGKIWDTSEQDESQEQGTLPIDISEFDGDVMASVQRANELYEEAQAALKEGSLSEYERLINELGVILKQIIE